MPRPVAYVIVAMLPAIAFENAASKFKIMGNRPGLKFTFSTVGSAAILFGILFAVDALFPESTDHRTIAAQIVDENCDIVDLSGEASIEFSPPGNVVSTYRSNGNVIVIAKPNTPLNVAFRKGQGGHEYRGTIGSDVSIHQEWRLGIDLTTTDGQRKCTR